MAKCDSGLVNTKPIQSFSWIANGSFSGPDLWHVWEPYSQLPLILSARAPLESAFVTCLWLFVKLPFERLSDQSLAHSPEQFGFLLVSRVGFRFSYNAIFQVASGWKGRIQCCNHGCWTPLFDGLELTSRERTLWNERLEIILPPPGRWWAKEKWMCIRPVFVSIVFMASSLSFGVIYTWRLVLIAGIPSA